MSKVLTFSTKFPSYHPRKGEPTYFVEKIHKSLIGIKSFEDRILIEKQLELELIEPMGSYFYDEEFELCAPKHHTIRAGNRFKAGDMFSPRIWSGRPYNSKQIVIAPDIRVEKVWDFQIQQPIIWVNNIPVSSSHELIKSVSENDGLEIKEFLDWFQYPKPFKGQIICWNKNINY
jgi:hypothetical protein